MTQTIKSRSVDKTSAEYKAALHEIAKEVAIELDVLVDKMDAFLEMRITQEFDELREDIDNLAIENAMLKDEVTALTIENIRLHIKLGNTP